MLLKLGKGHGTKLRESLLATMWFQHTTDMSSNLHVCYITVENGWRSYSKMTYVSAASVRRLHPTARITILTDEVAARAIQSTALAALATEIIVVPRKWTTRKLEVDISRPQ